MQKYKNIIRLGVAFLDFCVALRVFLCRIGTNATPVYKNCYMHPCLCYDE